MYRLQSVTAQWVLSGARYAWRHISADIAAARTVNHRLYSVAFRASQSALSGGEEYASPTGVGPQTAMPICELLQFSLRVRMCVWILASVLSAVLTRIRFCDEPALAEMEFSKQLPANAC
jgi:hypothetical protein